MIILEIQSFISRVQLYVHFLYRYHSKSQIASSSSLSFNNDNIRSSHKFVPTFVYTFHVSIYKHTAIRDQCT